ncbi:VOC family protein [Thalassotalea mangrovi]|uniref:VOC family protein n=1 Tax=Thalassotalea mangrovi TaxID=2572245 RepID=A0A4U1B3Q5_9GAMM|nr:VOC family protein [Thalassotalea mangrovi]TKB44639.1 VOC family protein [Thalassotalea mangrovi]
MSNHEKINYLEFPASDLGKVRAFYEQVFSWQFTEYGDTYLAFNDGVIDGGFYQADTQSTQQSGGVLVVLYSTNIGETEQKIVAAGGKISTPVFDFPGGRRFHFKDPNGNELAVWTDQP